MRKILVAGGAGYIGSHVCKALAAAGCVPVAYDNLVRGHAWAVKWGPLIEGDIADTALLKQVLRMHDIHVVMQLLAGRAQHSDLATIVQSAWRWHRGQSAAPAPKIAVG